MIPFKAIVSGQVPEKLANKEIIRLDVVSLVQGTGIRGQFEKRMQQLMEALGLAVHVLTISTGSLTLHIVHCVHEVFEASKTEIT